MPGKTPRISPLHSRKQLLIAESELNRAQLMEEWDAVADGVHTFAHRAKSFYSIASSTAVLVAGLAALRRGRSERAKAKHSWLQTIFKGAGLLSTLWMSLRSQGREKD